MTETSRRLPRWRMISFWFLMALLLFLHLGERPEQLGYVVTAFGGFPEGAGATHEIHWFALSLFTWTIVAAVAVQLRRPATQVGAAWVYGAGTLLAFSMVLALADLPADIVPIVAAAAVVAAIAFVAHPSSWRARFAPTARVSLPLFALVALAAVPLVTYALGQLDIHTSSGLHDEHFEFGHWVVMAVYALIIPVFGVVAAWKVSGWRFPLWAAGVMTAGLGIGSLGITAVSQWSTGWAWLAIAWGVLFIAVGEREARADRARGLDAEAPPEEQTERKPLTGTAPGEEA